jgi:hypothetical protein
VTDTQLASDGYRLEVDVVSEGQVHTWRRTTNGEWCRFTPLCRHACLEVAPSHLAGERVRAA